MSGKPEDDFNFSPPPNGHDVGASVLPKGDVPNIEVVIEDDTPEKDRGRPRRKEGQQPYDITDAEIDKYDDSVKSRIQKLRFEYHEERRLKEESARRELSAIEFARKLVAENSRLTSTLQQGEKTLIEVAKAKTINSMQAAKRDLAEAHAAGDSERISEATASISKFAAESEALNYQQPTITGKVPTPEESVRNFDTRVAADRAPIQPHAKAVGWYEKNKDWFEVDQEMTQMAKRLDAELITRHGSSPATDKHYAIIDNEMRKRFPDRFQEDDGEEIVFQQPVQQQQVQRQPNLRVGPVVRTNNTQPIVQRAPNRVVLSKSEVSIARKLGLSPEQYAEQKVKDYPNG